MLANFSQMFSKLGQMLKIVTLKFVKRYYSLVKSWPSLQTKKFERRDLLVTALTETVWELQKIFLCEVSKKESFLEEWLGIGDVDTYSWASKPGFQDPGAKAAYAIITCLEKVLCMDVNDIAKREDFATINERRHGKKED